MTDPMTNVPLASEFAPASLEQWRKLVEGVLKGAPFDRKLVAKTYDGLRIQVGATPPEEVEQIIRTGGRRLEQCSARPHRRRRSRSRQARFCCSSDTALTRAWTYMPS